MNSADAKTMIRIEPFEMKYQPEFKRLNMIWLDQFGLLETHDLEILDDPQGMVLENGGSIFLAMDGDKVVGTAGLYKEDEFSYELVKMSVEPSYRGRGIARLLLDTCLNLARDLGANRVFLYSNSQLQNAIRIYEQYGFRHIDTSNMPYVTADVKMELILDSKS